MKEEEGERAGCGGAGGREWEEEYLIVSLPLLGALPR